MLPRENATAMNFNSTEAMKNREWQEYMSNTAYQRAVEDMKKQVLILYWHSKTAAQARREVAQEQFQAQAWVRHHQVR